MTKEQKIEAFRMRLDGCTYQEIGERFGLRKQAVHQSLAHPTRRVSCPENIAYPGLARWMTENGVARRALAERCGMADSNMSSLLLGRTNPTKKYIDSILAVTGLSYEEAFGRASHDA